MSREMRHSGVEWIGDIPKAWKVSKLKYWILFINGYAFDSNSFSNDNGIPVIRQSDISTPLCLDKAYKVMYEEKLDSYRIRKGDIVIGMSGSLGKMCRITQDEEAYINQRVGIIRSSINPYIYYLLQTDGFEIHNDLLSFGTAILNISSYNIGMFPIPFPPLHVQQKIANYLDKVCGDINDMVALQEQMIEELKNYKQSVITEAVTKGLNPNTSMRNSGVYWIGAIPKHWGISKAKFYVNISNGSDPKTEGEIPVYGSGATSFKTCGEYKEGAAVLIGRKGATLHIPHYIEGKYWNVDTAFDVKSKGEINLKYYYYLAVSFDYRYYISQTTLPGMAQSSYNNMLIPIPPTSEQQSIASFLDEKCSEIDSLIAIKQTKIDELKEYKKSIIYEYVTGKTEVPYGD